MMPHAPTQPPALAAAAGPVDDAPGRSDGDALTRTEAALVARALEGDGRAFATLVRPHLGMLHRVAHRACSDDSLADDAVQEALTLAFERLGRYQPGTSLKAFLAAIAAKRAASLLRSRRRRLAREEASMAPAAPAAADQLVDASRAAIRVQRVLATLPDKRRRAALLRLDAGLSYAEIAEALDTTPGSARVLVHLATKQLREALAPWIDSTPSRSPAPRPEGGPR